MIKNPIIYFGNEQLAQGLENPITPVLDALIENNYPIKAIFTNYNPAQKSRSKRLPRPVELAEAHNIPIYTPHGKNELQAVLEPLIASFDLPPIGILAAYNIIIPDKILELFEPIGILNLHPSLLPKYRGSTPIESAILNGDSKTGISVMKLAHDMDAGPLFAQDEVTLPKSISKQELYEKLITTGANSLLNLLPNIQNLTPTPQPQTGATYTEKLNKSMSALKPSEKPASILEREIRAFKNFPKSKITLFDTPCTVTGANTATTPKTDLDQKCQDGNYLVINKLIPENSKEMTAEAFLNGQKSKNPK